MNKLSQGALACAVAALVAGCGADGTQNTQSPAASTAATMTSSAAQAGTHQISEYLPIVQSIYISYFGRPADPAGLQAFAERLQALNAPVDLVALSTMAETSVDLQGLLNGFNNSQESQELYAGDNSAFIDAIYQNLFGRAPDAAGKAFWLEAVNTGRLTKARASLNILAGAYNDPSSGDVTAINNRASVAQMFTTALDTGDKVRGYRGQTAAASARTILRTVNSGTNPSALAGDIASAITGMIQNLPLSPQGMYHGMLPGSGNTDINLLVLDDDTVYGFYGIQRASQYDVYGYTKSSALGNGSVLSGAMKDYGSGVGVDETISFNYSAGSALSGTINTKNGPVALTASPVAAAQYDYNAQAKLSDIVGSWTMSQRLGSPQATVEISANGTFTGSTTGCTFVGALAPRPSKNVFNLSITYGAGCELANQSVTGVAVTMLFNNGANRELVFIGTNGAINKGGMYWGVRPAG